MPHHRHILSYECLIRLGRDHGLQPVGMSDRFPFDTPWPLLNWAFLKEYAYQTGGVFDVFLEKPQFGRLLTSPRLMFLALFGYFVYSKENMIVAFRQKPSLRRNKKAAGTHVRRLEIVAAWKWLGVLRLQFAHGNKPTTPTTAQIATVVGSGSVTNCPPGMAFPPLLTTNESPFVADGSVIVGDVIEIVTTLTGRPIRPRTSDLRQPRHRATNRTKNSEPASER